MPSVAAQTEPPANGRAGAPEPRPSEAESAARHVGAPIRASQVLSTLNDDGSRRWLRPRVSKGRFLTWRRIVAYLLIAIFAAMPLLRLNGRPLILLDIAERKFHILGATFFPTDTLLVALLLVMVFLGVFWFTALFGRVWCGWACPQTVYMEFLFRPLERLFEGSPGRASRGLVRSPGLAKVAKWGSYVVFALVLSHMFLAYFVSWDKLATWVIGSPADHPLGFGIVMLVTALILLDFGILREQVCTLMCPYGRFQSVMLDRHSLIVRYDRKRGEPRGKKRRTAGVALPVLSGAESSPLGDCVDCSMCVTTCPTGIDIRNGLQMECIGCAQCIDACDAVMDKVGRPRGLIRYSSQAAEEGERFRLLRPRVLLYSTLIVVLGAIFTGALLSAGVADVTVLRGLGQPFTVLPSGEVRNTIRVKITNRMEEAAEFRLSATGLDGARLTSESRVAVIPAGDMLTIPAEIDVPADAFRDGKAQIFIVVSGPADAQIRRPFTLVGPYRHAENSPP